MPAAVLLQVSGARSDRRPGTEQTMRSPAPRRMREKTAPVTAAMDAPPMSGLVRSRLSLQGGMGRGRRALLGSHG